MALTEGFGRNADHEGLLSEGPMGPRSQEKTSLLETLVVRVWLTITPPPSASLVADLQVNETLRQLVVAKEKQENEKDATMAEQLRL